MIDDLVPVEGDLTSPEAIQALGFLLATDWSGGVEVRTSFQTNVQGSYSGSEQRWGMRGRPKRTVTIKAQATTPQEQFNLKAYIARAGNSHHLVPLACDVIHLTQSVSASATTLPCVPAMRRFFAGKLIAIYQGEGGFPSKWEVREIESVNADSLKVTEGIENGFSQGAMIVPLLVCDPLLSSEGTALSSHVSVLQFQVAESDGDTQLPLTTDLGGVPDGMVAGPNLPDNPLLLPVFPLEADFGNNNLAWGSSREVAEEVSGFSSSFDLIGERARYTFRLTIPCTSRDIAWQAIQFFESRGGRTFPFWLVSPQTEVSSPVVLSETQISIPASAHLSDWDAYNHIGFLLADGTTQVRAFTVEREYDNDILTFDAIEGLTDQSLRRASFAWPCRLLNDELVEVWRSSVAMTCTFDVIEVLRESDKFLDGLEEPVMIQTPLPWRAGICSGDVYEEPLPSIDTESLFYNLIFAGIGDGPQGSCYDGPPCSYEPCQVTDYWVSWAKLQSMGYSAIEETYSDTFQFVSESALGGGPCYAINQSEPPKEYVDPSKDMSSSLAGVSEGGCTESVNCIETTVPIWFKIVNCDNPEDFYWVELFGLWSILDLSPGTAVVGKVVRLEEGGPCYQVTGESTYEDPGALDVTDQVVEMLDGCDDCESPAPCECNSELESGVYQIVGWNVNFFSGVSLVDPESESGIYCSEPNIGTPAWDGRFSYTTPSFDCVWFHDGEGNSYTRYLNLAEGRSVPIGNDSVTAASVYLDTDNCRWILSIFVDCCLIENCFDNESTLESGMVWVGEKTTGNTPAGTYTRTSGASSIPTISIEAV